jgi:Cu(I)/Ag(I) efflux system membrane protein CusA/SilA
MIPMAIPTFGGMIIQTMTMFVVPILQCFWREGEVKKELKQSTAQSLSIGEEENHE